jgi:hypothetical protein
VERGERGLGGICRVGEPLNGRLVANQRMRSTPLLLLLLGAPAAPQTFGAPLTAEQVACEEHQLERLQHRMWVDLEGSTLLLWRASPAGGLYRGLVSTSELSGDLDHPARREEQLAFDLVLKNEEDFLDPRRPRRPQATLVRRDVASNLTSAPEIPFHTLDLKLDLAPTVIDPSFPHLPIRITNRIAPGAGADDRAGRGIAIADLLSSCHAEVSDFDLRVLAILARTVRPSQCLAVPFSTCTAALERYKVVFFRDSEPLTYRMNVYINTFTGIADAWAAFRFHLQVAKEGASSEVTWRPFPSVPATTWAVRMILAPILPCSSYLRCARVSTIKVWQSFVVQRA